MGHPDSNKNWFRLLEPQFNHPAIVFWRAVELGCIEATLNRFLPARRILDLGCAEGHIGSALFGKNSLIGIDMSGELLRQNIHEQTYAGLTLADACRMPFKDASFSGVFSNCVVEHIPDLARLLDQVHAVLGPGGRFLFTVPSASFGRNLSLSCLARRLCIRPLARWYERFRNRSLEHYHCYDHGRWEEILKERGFVLTHHAYYMDRRMTVIWDLLAVLWRVLMALRLPVSFLKRLNKSLIKRLQKYYNIYPTTGSGLLLVAEKA